MTNIFEKIAAIQSMVPTLQKEGELEMGGKKVKFLQIDFILEKLKPIIVEQKVIILPTLVDSDSHIKYGQEPPSEVDPNKWSGRITTLKIREKVIYDFMLVDTENPESRVTVRVSGEAMDNQDKASGKAFTSAQKSMMIKTFLLITGDPEIEDSTVSDEAAEEPKQARGAQMTEKARTKPAESKPSITTNPRPTSAAKPADDTTTLDAAKAKLRNAVANRKEAGQEISKEDVDKLGLTLTAKTRDQWLTSIRDINKIADAIEKGEIA